MMRHIYLMTSLLLIISGSTLFAQQNTVTTGGNVGNVSYTVGQTTFTIISGSGGTANLGVQQPYEVTPVGINDPRISLLTKVFPNPTANQLVLQAKMSTVKELTYFLYNNNGKQLLTGKTLKDETVIPLVKLPSATYLLKVVTPEKKSVTYKIIKN